MDDRWAGQVALLEGRVEADPGGEEFALLAEIYRRDGRLAEAERVARQGLARRPDSSAGLAVLALTLIDSGRSTAARVELEERAAAALGPVPGPGSEPALAGDERSEAVSELEFDRAFAAAQPQVEEMITPDRLAEEAALRVDGGVAEPADGAVVAEPARSEVLELGGAFSTQTMAELLEQQGDAHGAARIRATLESRLARPASPAPGAGPHAHVIATLERWLENVRRLST